MSSVISPVSGTPTGTPSRSGETLLAQSYFAKIVAYDQFDAPTTVSTETAAVTTTGTTSSIVWNWTDATGAASYRIYVGNTTGGQHTYFSATTNTFTQTAAVGTRNSLSGSLLNNLFFGEISLPATTATTSTVDVEYPINMALPPGYRIIDGFGTTVAAGWFITAYGGDY